jgi:cation diffusion facilitator family transporter
MTAVHSGEHLASAARRRPAEPSEAEVASGSQRRLLIVLLVALAVLAVKASAYWVTASQAIYSDAVETVANILSGSVALVTAWWGARPPDRNHPWGHAKAELFSAGLAGAIVLVAGVSILREAVPALTDPRPMERVGLGLGLAAIAGVINGAVGAWLLRAGRQRHSPALRGEGFHLLSDTLTTAGAIAGVALAWLFSLPRLDPLAACIIGVVVLMSGLRLLYEASARLLDTEDPELVGEVTDALERRRMDTWIDVHLLRARSAGPRVHVDFHVVLPRYYDLDRVHVEQDALADAVVEELGRPGDVLVHPDPCRPSHCPGCPVPACPVRSAPFTGRTPLEARGVREPGVGVDRESVPARS